MNICRYIWRKLYHVLESKKFIKETARKYELEKKVSNIVIFGTPNHGNLGDYAIYLAEKNLLEEYSPYSHVFDVNMAVFNKDVEALKKLLKNNDLLILTGGGNLGNQYMDDENIRRRVISLFPHNRIVIFPQTMFFTDDTIGNKEKEISKEIYNKHEHLLIAARDEFSYEEMQRAFSAKIVLVPDVVLTWAKPSEQKREGALLVLRSDVEGTLTENQINQLKNILKKQYSKLSMTDTVVDDCIGIEGFECALMKKLYEFQKAELVVTDRLHGMVFAAITQTPCIVLNNYNHKLRETYKWIEHLEYIQFIPDMDYVDETIQKFKIIPDCKYEMSRINGIYKEFLKEIFYG